MCGSDNAREVDRQLSAVILIRCIVINRQSRKVLIAETAGNLCTGVGANRNVDFLFPLGLRSGRLFTGADFFPIFPGLGSFLLGAAIGKSLYRSKQTLLPKVSPQNAVIRFLSFTGRHSLEIYLIHQPIIFALVMLLA